MGPLFIVVPAPILHFFLGVRKAEEPVRVEAFGPEAAVEGLDEGVVGRLAQPGEVQRDAALIGPQVPSTGSADRSRKSGRGNTLLSVVVWLIVALGLLTFAGHGRDADPLFTVIAQGRLLVRIPAPLGDHIEYTIVNVMRSNGGRR